MTNESELTIVIAGTTMNGDIDAAGPVKIDGVVNGNIKSNDKVIITGAVNGDIQSGELYAEKAKVKGNIAASGAIKISAESIIRGDVKGDSAVVAGAIRGNVDVSGLIVADTTAVIVGDIKSKAIQLNNGAVIDGNCKQTYAQIDYDELFAD